MSRTIGRAAATGLTLAAVLATPAAARAGPLRYGSSPAELSVSAMSEQTVRVVLAPLDEDGKPRPGPASTALVELKPVPKFRARDLAEAREVEAGKLRRQAPRPGVPGAAYRPGPGGRG
jgi:hypothetical protein